MKEIVCALVLAGLGHDQCEVREMAEWAARQCLYWGFREPAETAAQSHDPEVRRRAAMALEGHFNRVFPSAGVGYWPPIEHVGRDCPELRRLQLVADLGEWNGWWHARNDALRQELTERYAEWMVLRGVPPREVRAELLRAVTRESKAREKERKIENDCP